MYVCVCVCVSVCDIVVVLFMLFVDLICSFYFFVMFYLFFYLLLLFLCHWKIDWENRKIKKMVRIFCLFLLMILTLYWIMDVFVKFWDHKLYGPGLRYLATICFWPSDIILALNPNLVYLIFIIISKSFKWLWFKN